MSAYATPTHIQTPELVDTAEVARMLGLTREYVTDKLTKRPGFPKPAVNVSQRLRRWRRAEVEAWAGLREQA